MSISAVLLSGGESRRMGEDKANLLFHGKPLWQWQLDILRQVDVDEILISARTDPPWRPSNIKFVADDPPARGPLGGLAAALRQNRTDYLLALAIDMPFMAPEFLRTLCLQIEPARGVLPMIDDWAEPLAAIYPKESDVDFIEALAGTDFSLQTLTVRLVRVGKLRNVPVSRKEAAFFRNLNELKDLPT